jgi:hypothetical protein
MQERIQLSITQILESIELKYFGYMISDNCLLSLKYFHDHHSKSIHCKISPHFFLLICFLVVSAKRCFPIKQKMQSAIAFISIPQCIYFSLFLCQCLHLFHIYLKENNSIHTCSIIDKTKTSYSLKHVE